MKEEHHVARIISGKTILRTRQNEYIYQTPSRHDLYKAELFFYETLDKNKYHIVLTEKNVVGTLIQLGLWNMKLETEFINLPIKISDAKVEMYQLYLRTKNVKKQRKDLRRLNKRLVDLTKLRHSLDYITLEGYCRGLKNQMIVTMGVDKPVHTFTELQQIVCEVNRQEIPINEYRKIAQSEYWRSIWSSNERDVFGVPAVDLTDEQRALMSYTMMYDNIYKHNDCPTKEIIKDNDLIDGWMIKNSRQSDEDKVTKSLAGRINKNAKANSDVYIIAQNQDEIKQIHDMNSNTSKVIAGQRMQAVKAHKTLKYNQLPGQ